LHADLDRARRFGAAAGRPLKEISSPSTVTPAFIAGLVAGYAVAIPIGAIGSYLLQITARTSLRVGMAAALGIATADGLYAGLPVAGGTGLAPVARSNAATLHWVAAAVMFALAGRILLLAINDYSANCATSENVRRIPKPRRAYLALLGLTLLNPVTIIYFAALVVGERVGTTGTVDGIPFVLGVFLASASWQTTLAGAGSLLGHLLAGRRGRLVTALLSSIAIAVTALRVLLR
jgi:arginine exporter protein ArgO